MARSGSAWGVNRISSECDCARTVIRILFNRGSSSSITSDGSLTMNFANAINPNESEDVRMSAGTPSGSGCARNAFRVAFTVIKPKMGSRRVANKLRISVVPSKT